MRSVLAVLVLMGGFLLHSCRRKVPQPEVITRVGQTYGDTGRDAAFAVQQTADRGYILAGYTETFTYPAGYHVFLVKTDPEGNAQWTETLQRGIAYAVMEAPEGKYLVVGHAGGDLYVARVGGYIWERTYGFSGEERGYAVDRTPDGHFIVAGFTTSFGAGKKDVYLLKVHAAGDTFWTRTFGGGRNDEARAVLTTPDGGFLIAGSTTSFNEDSIPDVYLIKTDENGDLLWSRTLGVDSVAEGAYDVVPAADGGWVILGWAGRPDAVPLLVKTDAEGNEVWSRTLSLGYDTELFSISPADDGGFVLAGQTWTPDSGGKVLLVKTDAEGQVQWSRTLGGASWDVGRDVQQTADGGYIIAGHTWSFGAGKTDAYLLKTDGDGNPEWVFQDTLSPFP